MHHYVVNIRYTFYSPYNGANFIMKYLDPVQ